MDRHKEEKRVPFFSKLIASGFFSGYFPVAPGTAGSAVGLLIYFIPSFENPLIMFTGIIAAFFLGVITSNQMEKQLGEDPSAVVIDEIVGMWISLFFVPKQLWFILGSFILFRIFDIVKPQPARYMEKYPNGWGIMLDDVIAGIYANVSMQIIIFIVHKISTGTQ